MTMRFMATSTKALQPSVQLFGLDGTYVSTQSNFVLGVFDILLLLSLQHLLKMKSRYFPSRISFKKMLNSEIISNPALSTGDKVTILETVTKVAKVDLTTFNLLAVLSNKEPLGLIPEIISKYETLANVYKGLIEAIVTLGYRT
ncbi:hypothetical protein NADFUDRAFT_65602 [Nadsonia fulvescens var. elongata DSM 6958]|uniref:ATP synthase subunit 5, mitochondrial n=1 Tax=Nadsonia fulvescens var. elongata DSM 6958 TaxID=857566 RepID=A0A1E3PLN2_9ASCO|nr:hypothetical protein NADFUDRAFT_65602 [Nadsonia fulvescens var. elongata DSM 6958]